MFDLVIDTKEFEKQMNGVAKKQLPFATSLALNATMEQVQKKIITDLPGKFTLRKQWWKPRTKYGINLEKSNKRSLSAAVFTRAPWMQLHETGGTKLPRGTHLAMPTGNLKRTKKGLIGKAKWPRNLRRKFVIKSKSGHQELIMQRKSKRKIHVVYVLEHQAKIKKTWGFVETGLKVARKVFPKNWDEAFTKAIRTAR